MPHRWLRRTAGPVVVLTAAVVAAPSGGSSPAPNDDEMRELRVRSHGVERYAHPSHWDWRGEDGYGASGVIDYPSDPTPRRLPIHPGGVIRVKPEAPARAIVVHFPRRDGWRDVAAKPRGESGTRWRLRAPRHLKRKGEIGIDADYRYEKDGELYGTRYSFFLHTRLHRHR